MASGKGRKYGVALGDEKQGRIHSYPSRVRVGRGSDGEGHWGIWAGAVSFKNAEKVKWGPTNRPIDRLTDRPADRPTDRQSGV